MPPHEPSPTEHRQPAGRPCRAAPLPLLLLALAAAPLAVAPRDAGAARPADGCRDPWLTRAVREVAGRAPRGGGDAGECDLRLYGSRWGSYEELRDQVAVAFAALRSAGLEHDRDGDALRERGGREVPLGAVYLGPRRRAPARQVTVALARDHVLAFDWPAPAGRPPAATRPDPAAPPSHPEQTR